MNESYRRTLQTARQPFDVLNPPSQKAFKLEGGNIVFSIWNGLIITATIGLFAYVNTYFLINLSQLVSKAAFTQTTQTFNCNNFFCDRTMYYVLHYNTFYQNCNPTNCQNIICTGYSCIDGLNNPDYYSSVNAYYSCYPTCVSSMVDAPVPSTISASYIVAIVAASLFGFACINSILSGIVMGITFKGLSGKERIGIILTLFMPGLKYTLFRQRTQWAHFTASTKLIVLCDLVNTIIYGAVWGMYIYLSTVGFFLSAIEVACFFFLLANYLSYIGIVARNFRTFWNLTSLIRQSQVSY